MTATQQPDPLGAGPVKSGPSGPRAGFWKRCAASFIDGLILFVPYLVIAAATSPAAGYAIYLLASIAYFTIMEGSPSGQTIGKRALGIRVIDMGGRGSIGNTRAFIRWIGKQISGLVLLLGYLWMLWDKEKQTWHDKMATSVVVPVSDYPIG